MTTTHAEGWRRHRPGAGSPFCAAQRAKRRRQHARRQAVRRLDDKQAAAHRRADRLGVPAVANVRPRTHRNSLGHYLARLSRSSSLAQVHLLKCLAHLWSSSAAPPDGRAGRVRLSAQQQIARPHVTVAVHDVGLVPERRREAPRRRRLAAPFAPEEQRVGANCVALRVRRGGGEMRQTHPKSSCSGAERAADAVLGLSGSV